MKASGETDFRCVIGTRVGRGRTCVRLGTQSRVDYGQWAQGIARGRCYVSGYAHALEFTVDGRSSGDEVQLGGSRTVTVEGVEAERAYDQAPAIDRRIAAESPADR